MTLRRCWLVLALAVSAVVEAPRQLAAAPSTPSAEINQHDVIPIMLRRCTVCHGPRRQEAGLDLRTKASMLKGGKSGPAIALGKPDESLLIKRVRLGQMPPNERLVDASVKPIEPAEIEVLAQWIAAGAPEIEIKPDVATTEPDPMVTDKDRDFWAFQPLPLARIGNSSYPLKNAARVRNPIDVFILQKLEAKRLRFFRDCARKKWPRSGAVRTGRLS